uniref:DUF3752 domain-containing protein n=1 Tax=Vannella robusta TaxID=1487602 RepID=A0A7S4I5D2_9EUKA
MDEIGPALPPHMLKDAKENKVSKRDIDEEDAAPPPKRRRVMGPSVSDLVAEPVTSEVIIGPPPPGELSTIDVVSNDEDIDGQWEQVMRKPDQTSKQVREDWMLSLPAGTRTQKIQNKSQKTFAKNTVRDLDDSWTKAPQNSANTSRGSKTAQKPTKQLSAPKKSAGPSLLELHQQKLKAKEQESLGDTEPKRWDRERDFLGIGKTMSRSNREKIIKEASNLHSRFASSS